MGWSPQDDRRVEAVLSCANGDERPEVGAALASLKDAPPRLACATLVGVAIKPCARVRRPGTRDKSVGHDVVAVLRGLAAAGAVELEPGTDPDIVRREYEC